MAISAGSPYEIPKEGEGTTPDFTYTDGDKAEQEYGLLFLLLLADLYDKYKKYETVDYALRNITKDTRIIYTKLVQNTTKLKEIFNQTVENSLTSTGILQENIPKTNITPNIISNGLLEQKTTIKGITDELHNNILSKAYFLKNRNAETLFNIDSNFTRATRRVKQMAESGYNTTVAKAEREADIYKYGDPLAYWITKNDSRVCRWCRHLEAASPMPLSMLPYNPLHNKCRCRVKLADNLALTDRASALTTYLI